MSENNLPFIQFAEPGAEQISGRDLSLAVLWARDLLYVAARDVHKGLIISLHGYRLNTNKIADGSEKLPRIVTDLAQVSTHRRVIISTPYVNLVPKSVFRQDDQSQYLGFTHNLPSGITVMNEEISGLDVVSIFGADKRMIDFLNRAFRFPDYRHTASQFVESVFRHYKNTLSDDQFYVNITGQRQEMALFTGQRLNYYNQFEFKSKEDYIYYLLFAAEQLNLNPETFQLILSGDVEEDSPLMKISEKYVRHVLFLGRPTAVKTGPILNQIPGHQHWLLFNSMI